VLTTPTEWGGFTHRYFKAPTSVEEQVAARDAIAAWARLTYGWLGRFPLCVYTTVRMEDDAKTAERVTAEFLATYYGGGVHSRGTMGLGPASAVIDALGRYADAGVTDVCLRFVGDDQRAQLERFTAEVLPQLR